MSMSDDPRGFRRGQGGGRDQAPRQGRGGRAGPPAEERYEGYRQPEAAPQRPQRPPPDKPQPTFSAYKPEAYAKPEPGPAAPPERPEWDMGGRGAPPPRPAPPPPQGDPYSRPSQDPFYSDAPSDPYAPRSPRGFEPDWARDPYQDTRDPYQDTRDPYQDTHDSYQDPGYPDSGPPSFPNYYPPMDEGPPSGPDAQSMHDRFFAPDPGADDPAAPPPPPPPPQADRFRSAFDQTDFGGDDPRHYDEDPLGPEPADDFAPGGFGGGHADPLRDDPDAYGGPYEEQYYDWDQYDQGPPPAAARPAPRPPMEEDDLDADFFDDEDDFDDEFEPESGGGRKKLVAAVLTGAIVVGGGLAYVYKTTNGQGGGSPSVITADSTPVKEEPADPGGRDFPNGNKQIYDRLIDDDGSSSARLASSGSSAQPTSSGGDESAVGGVITTGSGTLEERIENALRTQGGATESSGTAEGPSPDAPRSVRTVTFGPDGAQQAAEPDTQRVAAASSGGADSANGIITTGRGTASAPSYGTGQLETQSTNAALPDSSGQDSGGQQIAAISPQQPAPSQQPAAVANDASGFFVQIGARNDQAAAQAALPTLQQRYASVIGSSTFSVRKVDLGAKGVWYRMLIGPYGSKGEADTVCEQLKGAGMRECLSRKY